MPLVQANILSDWRRSLVSELRTAYPNAVLESKRRSGVNREPEPRIAVFFDGYREIGGRVMVAQPVMVIRFWPTRSELDSTDDPTELEQAAIDLLRLLQDRMSQIQASVEDLWYFRTESVVLDEDPDEWGVEARLTGFCRNLAVPA